MQMLNWETKEIVKFLDDIKRKFWVTLEQEVRGNIAIQYKGNKFSQGKTSSNQSGLESYQYKC